MTTMHDWNLLPREFVRKGIERCGFRGEDAILVMNWISPDIAVRPHTHTFEQLVVCVQGQFRYHVGDEVFHMTPGCMLRVPPHTLHHVEPVGDEVALNLDIFAPLRADYAHLVEYQRAEFTTPGPAPARPEHVPQS
ncbi:AraC family ligand binding domain-containing protein [Ramlibacter algicola]|uniref:AraC family ligand binding domain-containing protein n=1 Tax=Ramlibacter algicola TaxID=2795217 RepID=A0A934Q0N4_9BURK|nr:AraC family ligand binding domain-containing protein [Ramlibacter algicola]MBK0392129.1 AraC family ligand binding domain-containing protein [Ramlibacter algicola]